MLTGAVLVQRKGALSVKDGESLQTGDQVTFERPRERHPSRERAVCAAGRARLPGGETEGETPADP